MSVVNGANESKKRTSIHVRKTLHADLDKARNPGQSFNGYIRQLLEESLK